MGLAGPSNKVKIGLDPRNTNWANNTDQFGHQQMLKMGWTPGKGLGYTNIGSTSHVKVKVKRDNIGLGKDLSTEDQPHGLDVFQALLGRLNGTEEKVSRQLAEKNRQQGVYLTFVSGGVLEGTIEKMLEKRKRSDVETSSEPSKKKKSDKKVKKEKKASSESHKEKKEKKDKKDKKNKKEKKEKHDRKEKKQTKPDPVDTNSSEEVKSNPPAPRGIRATRSRFIAMKKQATADDKRLQEILMSLN